MCVDAQRTVNIERLLPASNPTHGDRLTEIAHMVGMKVSQQDSRKFAERQLRQIRERRTGST